MPWLTPEESLKACYSKPEPKRAPYRADRPAMPPIPARCPRCQGYVLTQYNETKCLNCAWYLQPLPLPQEPTMAKSGAQLPQVMEVGR
jgi:hypothetical protein